MGGQNLPGAYNRLPCKGGFKYTDKHRHPVTLLKGYQSFINEFLLDLKLNVVLLNLDWVVQSFLPKIIF